MRTFALSTLREFWQAGHADAEGPLRTWYGIVEGARWQNMADVRRDLPSTDLVDGRFLVFNIGGNKYRLVCRIRFGRPGVYVVWVGTHSDYDKLDIKRL